MEHVRIDEGVERGPRLVPASWPARKPPTAGKLGPNFDVRPVLERYLEGEELADIAADYQVHPKALNYHLLKDHVREAWRNAQVAVSLAEKQEAEAVLRAAPDALSLARAREILRSAQWDLERLEGRLFGQKQQLTVEVTVDLADRLRRAKGRIVGPVVAVQELAQVTDCTGDAVRHEAREEK